MTSFKYILLTVAFDSNPTNFCTQKVPRLFKDRDSLRKAYKKLDLDKIDAMIFEVLPNGKTTVAPWSTVS